MSPTKRHSWPIAKIPSYSTGSSYVSSEPADLSSDNGQACSLPQSRSQSPTLPPPATASASKSVKEKKPDGEVKKKRNLIPECFKRRCAICAGVVYRTVTPYLDGRRTFYFTNRYVHRVIVAVVASAVLLCTSLSLFVFITRGIVRPPYNNVPIYATINHIKHQQPSLAMPPKRVHRTDQYIPLESFDLHEKPKAALISLVRNQEIDGIEMSMRQLEARFNRKYNYPWIFFNDVPFDDDFKARTQNLTASECQYVHIPKEHWSLPHWIDQERFAASLEYLGAIGVGKGWMISYRHMCRWNSGFFYKHPILDDYDYYWRVEPDVHFFCDLEYDPFAFMAENGLKYGFNMNILDDARSFPSLWQQTKEFMAEYPDLIHPDADLSWLRDPRNNQEYNNCQFFSNFEIGSLDFFRSSTYNAYFDFIDRKGGFFYERFGDAPLHTLAIALFMAKNETHFFRDIGYQHDINRQCPANLADKCSCEPTNLDDNFYKLVPMESRQRKPDDTCIRLWLGGEWLERDEETGAYVKSGFSY